MPRLSMRNQLLEQLDEAELALAKARLERTLITLNDLYDSDSSDSESDSDSDSDLGLDLMVTPPSPLTPQLSDLSDSSSSDGSDGFTTHYNRLHDTITALRDEVTRARVLHKPDAPPMRAPQIQLLHDFGHSRHHLFRKKLRVNPDIFDNILDQISDHPIFTNRSNNPQLPIAIQLAIFLNRAGHYGNAISPDDVGQWAGVSVGSVINCSNRVMIALLDQHDTFINFPAPDSEDAERARQYVEAKSCPEWRNGIFAIDGSAINLYEKPGLYGEAFYDRKSNYSLNCQVFFLSYSNG
jgi:hypothetical protein